MAGVTWKGGPGTWDTATLWSSGIVPTSADAVTIDAAGSYTVSLAGTADAAASLTLDAATVTLDVTGTLALGTTLAAKAGTLQLENGRIEGGTLALGGATLLAYGGTLDGVTVLGPLTLARPGEALTIDGGFTLLADNGTQPGTLAISGGGGIVTVADTETLDHIVISLGTVGGFFDVRATLSFGTVATMTLAGANAVILFDNLTGGAATLDNAGGIALTGTNDTLNVELSFFVNSGSISLGAGGVLEVTHLGAAEGTFSNTGSISFGTGGTLIIGNAVDATDLAGIAMNGGTLFLEGAYANAGQTLTTTASGVLSNVVLEGGTIAGGTVAPGPGSLKIGYQETFDAVTWNATTLTLGTGADLILLGGLTFAAGSDTLDLSGGGFLARDSETLDNIVIMLGNGARLGTFGSGTLTLGSSAPTTLDSPGTASITGVSVSNAGTITVGAGLLAITATSFSNPGTIAISGGTVDFAGSVTAASFGNVVNTGGTVEIGGTLVNTGTTLTLPPQGTFSNILLSGTIQGGAVQLAGGRLDFVRAATLAGVNYDGTLDLSADESYVDITGGIVLHGSSDTGPGAILLTGGAAELEVGTTTTFDNATITAGNAQVAAADTLYGDQIAVDATLTLGRNLVLTDQGPAATGTLVGAGLYIGGNKLINAGTMQAMAVGGTLDIGTESFVNTGTITVATGAVLEFQAILTTANLGSIENSGGTVDFGNQLTNTGATLNVAPGSALAITRFDSGADIVGGTVVLNGGTAEFTGAQFTGVIVDGAVDLSAAGAALSLAGGITLHPVGGIGAGSLALTGAGANLAVNDAETLDNATITIGNATTAATIGVGYTLTLGANLLVQETGAGALGLIGGFGAVINDGTITATGVGSRLTIDASSGFTNAGSLGIGSGALLAVHFAGGNAASIGTLTNSGGTFEILGTLNNAGSLLDITATSPYAGALLDGVLTGGTVAMDGGALTFAGTSLGGAGGTLSAITVMGVLDLSTAFATAVLEDGVTLVANGDTAAAVNLTGVGAALFAQDSETLDHAVVTIGNAATSDALGIDTTLTLGAGLLLNETAAGANAAVSGATLINDGTIAADAAGGELALTVADFIGGSGTLSIGAGGYLSVAVDGALSSLGTILNAGGTLGLAGTLNNTGSTLVIGASGALSDVVLDGTIEGGTVEVDGGVLQFGSSAVLDGVTFIGPTIDLDNAGAGLTFQVGTTLSSGSANPVVISVAGPPTKFLNFDGGTTLSDAAILVSGTSDQLDIGLFSPGTVTFAANTSLAVGANTRVLLGSDIDSAAFADAGTITVAPAGTLGLGGPSVVDSGTIALSAGAEVQILDTSLSTTGWIGSVGGSGGTLQVDLAALDLGGGTLSIAASAPFADVQNYGTIANGTIINTGTYAPNVSVLQDITFDGVLDLSALGQREIEENGLRLNAADGTSPGTVELTGLGSQLQFEDASTLDHATVVLAGGPTLVAGVTTATAISFASNLHFGAGLTIDATTSGAASQIYGDGSLTSAATIDVGTGAALLIAPHVVGSMNFVDTGPIDLAAGGTLTLDANTSTANLANIDNAGGTLLLGGTLNNAGGTISVGPSGTFADLVLGAPNVVISGGSFADAGGTLVFAGYDEFDNVAFSGPLHVGNGADVYFASTSTLAPGSVSIDGNAVLTLATLAAGQSVTVSSGLFEDAGGGDSGASFAFTGTATLDLDTPGSFLTPIGGFGPGSTIYLQTPLVTGLGYADGILSVQDSGDTVAQLHVGTGYSLQDFGFTASDGGYDITSSASAACFATGTRIRTVRGAVAVEDLREGDLAVTDSGPVRPIRWIGHRSVDCRRHPNRQALWPVRVRADALGPGRPQRDLLLSPDHAVFIDGVLVPIRYLIDGAAIAPQVQDRVTYWHVELDRHDVILAEGLACESFLDSGNRAAFANGGGIVQMHADVARRHWDADACAPLVIAGPRLDGIRAALGQQRRRPPASARTGRPSHART